MIAELTDTSEQKLIAQENGIKNLNNKISDIDSRIELNKMNLDNFLVDKEKIQKSIITTNAKAEVNHKQILNIDAGIKKLEEAVEGTHVS